MAASSSKITNESPEQGNQPESPEKGEEASIPKADFDKNATAPVDWPGHIGSCRGLGMIYDNYHGQFMWEGKAYKATCPCCSKPTTCPVCMEAIDLMLDMFNKKLAKRKAKKKQQLEHAQT